MLDFLLLHSLGTMVVVAAAMVLLLRRLNVPNLFSFLIAGLLVSQLIPYLSFLAQQDAALKISDQVSLIAEVGIVLLLFLVGLELSFDKIRDVGKVAVVAGLGQVVFTAAGGMILTLLLGFSMMESIFLSVALTFSSTIVVVKLLDQKKDLHSLYGRIAVGIFLVQDMVVIVVLTFLAGLGDPENFNYKVALLDLLQAFSGMAVILALSIGASKWGLPKVFDWGSRSAETLVIWSLGWCFFFVVLAEHMKLSPEIGAFLAGISLAQLPCSGDLKRRLHPLMDFFVAIFFISLGAQMELGEVREHWFSAIALSLFVLIGNPFIFMWIIRKFGYDQKTSFYTSVTVAQISEFSFVFAAMGLSAGLIGNSIMSLVAMVGLVTIAISSYMILYCDKLYGMVESKGVLKIFKSRRIRAEELAPQELLSEHIIIVGVNTLGRVLAESLHEKGELVLAVDTDRRKLADLPCRVIVGNVDFLSVLNEVQFQSAKLLISTLHIEDINNLLAYRCKIEGIPVAIHSFDRSVESELLSLDVDYLLRSKEAIVESIFKAVSSQIKAQQQLVGGS